MPHTYKDLTGQKFGRLTVIKRNDNYISSGKGKVYWDVICECGNTATVRGTSLTQGISKSCGCLQKELMSQRAKKHGGFGTRLYNVWDSMRQRCLNPNNRAYHYYGGRGIKIAPEWDDYMEFYKWQMSNGYNPEAKHGECTLDRIDVNGNYSPENCRWVSIKEQSKNKRTSIYLTYNGETHTLKEWTNILGINYYAQWKRYKNNLSVERILRPTKHVR